MARGRRRGAAFSRGRGGVLEGATARYGLGLGLGRRPVSLSAAAVGGSGTRTRPGAPPQRPLGSQRQRPLAVRGVRLLARGLELLLQGLRKGERSAAARGDNDL